MSPFAKLGRVAGQTIRGWLRHAMETILIQQGISVCHPLSALSVTADRNKDYFKNDLALGYHPRGECKAEGGCLIYQIFGDLDLPGNLITQSVYFFPTTSGDGTITRNVNKLFGGIGAGRLEVINNSPRCRNQTHQVYLTVENLAGVMIEAPIKFIFRTPNKDQEVVFLKSIEYLKTMVQNNEFDFLLGGMRTSGYGKAAVLPLKPKKEKKPKMKPLIPLEEPTNGNTDEENDTKNYVIQFKLDSAENEKLEKEFLEVVSKQKAKFPIKKDEEVKQEQG